MKLKHNRGFTLIELIIVIAVLGILAALLIPKVIGVKDNATLGVNRSNLKILQETLANYRAQNDEYPQVATVLLFEKELTDNGKGTYELAKIPKYKDGSQMVKTYTCASHTDDYTIILKDDVDTIYDEDGVVLTDGTNTNKLFK